MFRASSFALFTALALSGAAQASEVSTSFEFTDLSGSFTLGTSPKSVTFDNGEAKTVGVPALYHTGTHAWFIPVGNTGEILFETPVFDVDLWTRDETVSNNGVLKVIDTNGTEILSLDLTTTYQNVQITLTGPVAPIDKITVQNNGASGHSIVDDFTSCAVEPGPIADPIPAPIATGGETIRLIQVADGLIAPNWGTSNAVSIASLPSPGTRLFVTDQAGVLYSINPNSGEKVVFLDITSQLVSLGIAGPGTFDERGLLGVAFHPDYETNGLLYTYTSEPDNGSPDFTTLSGGQVANHHTVITEWNVQSPTALPDAGDPTTVVDLASERELMRIDQPQFNHDGGALDFGPDDLLYIALGDGGSADDQGDGHVVGGNGQDAGNILGTLLRIDPLGNNSANGNYGIPAGNPFVADGTKLDEIYAYGLRNPFRFSFDIGTTGNPGTNDLYLADVGQNDIEEIHVVAPGDNLGWPCREGAFFFDMDGANPGFVTGVPPHTVPDGLVDPIAQYDHDEGTAIIGGFVYRGSAIPSLSGRYIFGEWAQTFSQDGRLFYLDGSNTVLEFGLAGQSSVGLFVQGFGQGPDGEVYLLANTTGVPFPDGGNQPTGGIWRIAPDTGIIDFGRGKTGSNDMVPRMSGSGPLTAGSANSLTIANGPSFQLIFFIYGATAINAPFKGGTLVPSPDAIVAGGFTGFLGDFSTPFTVPVGTPPGTTLYLQGVIKDGADPFGVAITNALLLVTNP